MDHKKIYNLTKLFEEEEFDAQKGYHRCGTKEAYFSVLYMFTRDSQALLNQCMPQLFTGGDVDTDTCIRVAERLQGALANIGAINLAWRLQSLNSLLDKKYYAEFKRRFADILPDIERLRIRIVDAEKSEENTVQSFDDSSQDDGRLASAALKRRTKPRAADFEKLLMLIDNFEFESADKTASHIMRNSYTPYVDSALAEIRKALHEFNFTKSLDMATELLNTVVKEQNSGKSAKKNILAVDDMPDVLRTVKAMLKGKYNVYGMTNYDSAIKFLRGNTADLILLDIEMPGLDGFAMLQLFRNIPEYAETPVIFLTGNVSDEHIKMAVRLGARDFIKKPVDLAVLLERLEMALS